MGNASDFFRKFQPLFESKDKDKETCGDNVDTDRPLAKDNPKHIAALSKALADNPAKKPAKKSESVEETAERFAREYSTMVLENVEDDEDPDVAIADKEKGKDKKTQKDADKDEPWWLKKKLEILDKRDQNAASKVVANKKDKEEKLDEATKCPICKNQQKKILKATQNTAKDTSF